MLPNLASSLVQGAQITPRAIDPSQLDPITLQRMMQIFPQLGQTKRKSERLREHQKKAQELAGTKGKGNYVPTQHGGLYETVAQYQPDYAETGNKVLGALGDYFYGKKADEAESEYDTQRSGEILRTLNQMDQPGQQTSKLLRGYLGMLGGGDFKDLAAANKVRSTQKLANGNLGIVTDAGIEDTGVPYDYGVQMIQNPEDGAWSAIGKSGGGRGVASPVMTGGQTAQPPAPVNFDPNMSPENLAIAQQDWANNPGRMQPGEVDLGQIQRPVPQAGTPGGVFSTATPAQAAAAVELAKLGAQVQMAPQTNAAAAQGEQMKMDEKAAAENRANLPQFQANMAAMESSIGQLLDPANDAALRNITGRTIGGNIPDISFDVDGKSHMSLARQAWDIANSGKPEAKMMALHDQLKGQVFLQAFKMLKGGGQITNVEGEKATLAYARMKRSTNTEDYKAALQEFRQAARDGYAKIQAAATGQYSAGGPGVAAPYGAAPAAPPSDPRAALRSKYGL